MLKVFFCFLFVFFLTNDCLQAVTADEIFSKKGSSLVMGIICAIPGESADLLEHMETPIVSYEKGMRTFHKGKLFGVDTVLVFGRVGKVASAATAAHLIIEHEVDIVIFTGVAGAIDPCLNVGDVVVANALMQYDMNASPFCPRYELPMLRIRELHPDHLLEQFAFQASQHFVKNDLLKAIPQSVLDEFYISQPKAMKGLIITGDQVISQEEHKGALKKEIPQALCVEMEGASVSQVCFEYGVPCVVIRTISDYANHEKMPIDVKRFVHQASGYYAVGVIQNLCTSIKMHCRSRF